MGGMVERANFEYSLTLSSHTSSRQRMAHMSARTVRIFIYIETVIVWVSLFCVLCSVFLCLCLFRMRVWSGVLEAAAAAGHDTTTRCQVMTFVAIYPLIWNLWCRTRSAVMFAVFFAFMFQLSVRYIMWTSVEVEFGSRFWI